jgi:hypothetical protein
VLATPVVAGNEFQVEFEFLGVALEEELFFEQRLFAVVQHVFHFVYGLVAGD